MTNDPIFRQLFSICKEKNKFVFEVCDVFGDKLTIEEMEYWLAYNIITSANIYDVDISHMSFENAIDEIDDAIQKRKKKWQPRKSSQKRIG